MLGPLVVGSIGLDTIESRGEVRTEVLGGSAAYFAAAASFLGPVSVVAVVGDDFSPEHRDCLHKFGANLDGLASAAGRTFRWHARYSDDFNKRTTLDTQLNVFAGFRPELPPAYRQARLVFLGNIDPHLQLRVLDQIENAALVGMDTMNFWISGSRPALLQVLKRIDFLLLNDEEARMLSGEHNLVRAAHGIHKLGAKGVIIKRGDAGALLFHGDHTFAAPAMPLSDVVDPTGAGDSFAGGFMGFLGRVFAGGSLDGMAVRRAMICGSTMASFCCEDFSLDRFRTLSSDEIEARFLRFRHLTHFDELRL
jgi:sugar/nucleoside kinase (ribokinase family)